MPYRIARANYFATMGIAVRQGRGLAAGLAGAIGMSRFVGSLLFAVAPTDPATLGAVTLLLLTTAAAAAALPARRATQVDPVQVLREP